MLAVYYLCSARVDINKQKKKNHLDLVRLYFLARRIL